jgi:hypothetical protein
MTEESNIEELEKKYKASLEAKLAEFEAQKKADEEAKLKAEAEKQKKESFTALKAELEKEFIEKYNLKPKEEVKLPDNVDVETFNKVRAFLGVNDGWKPGQSAEQSGSNANDKFMHNAEAFLKKEFKQLKATRGLEFEPKVIPYGNQDYFNGLTDKDFSGLKATASDTGCDDNYVAWVPADYYANAIWYAMTCKGFLAGKVTVRGLDVSAGKGGRIQIRTVGARTAQGPMGACSCFTCASNTWGDYYTIVDVYGDYAIICDKDIFEAGEVIVTATLKTMSDALAVALDAEIYNQLTTATPGYTETSTASFICDPALGGSCCSYAANLYREVLQLQSRMRAAGYNPDYLIVHPRIANYLKYKEAIHAPVWMDGEVTVKDGYLISIAGLKVIEYCGASTCSDNEAGSSPRVAIMIDSSRAVSEAWGKKPAFEKDRNAPCLSTGYVVAMYVGIDELDLGAIGHINNP